MLKGFHFGYHLALRARVMGLTGGQRKEEGIIQEDKRTSMIVSIN
jgi:hypothetical protein